MKLAYYRSAPTNFGDELNAYMWPRLLPPGFLDDDDSELFVGIGSIFGEMFPRDSVKHVMGSGIAGYFPRPDLQNGRWNVVFVRGPRTAATLGLPSETAICDSAILLREIDDLPPAAPGIGVAFMPHFQSLPTGNWGPVCRRAGITLIDPTDPPEEVIAQIRGADVLISEAMHGAIVADALRVPWIVARPFARGHHEKWNDWAESLGLDLTWTQHWPSGVRELVVLIAGKGATRLKEHRWPDSMLAVPLADLLVRASAWKLRRIARRTRGQLSEDAAIARATERARARLNDFVAMRAAAAE